MDLKEIKKAHFVGVSGIGVSAIARLFHSRGIDISGTDIHLSNALTLPKGRYLNSHDAAHLLPDTDILIYSDAVPETNPERAAARAQGIGERSYAQMLGSVTEPHETIAVTGTHGKSTTTALMAKFFEAGGFDPSVVVGAIVPGWNSNLRIGNSSLFIVEADEYRRHMMELEPQTIILTNLEHDHPDYYANLDDVKSAFRDFIGKLSGEDLLIVNNDDPNIRDVCGDFDGMIVRYGIGAGTDLLARNVRQSEDKQLFELTWQGTRIGDFETMLPGIYNIYNILAAVATFLAYGGDSNFIQGVLNEFTGVGRRFEILGKLDETLIISDYAHHPTALRAVVEAAYGRYVGKEILVVFRPHHKVRTKEFFDEFVQTFIAIPHLLLLEIYSVPGREEETTIASQSLIDAALAIKPTADIGYAETLERAEIIIRAGVRDFDVILIVGAGDTDQLANRLVSQI